jgi:hypothetical protein
MPNSAEETGPCKIEFAKLGRQVPKAAARCLADPRKPPLIKHVATHMLHQGVYGLALGGEDLNDHGSLRDDVAMQTRLLPMPYY